ncbi:sulfotransferase family protein [Mycobacterium sp. MS1601]|uniref:sulfotransferase family protein n=1 Tax=Mycobacterium sp. MS1601 TaxID=1936029 RepID=UPI00097983C1|nr:sulfotransferase [Mycobacterium sp. MS1601]AQA04070.1 sulfotransferase family protein [Mycobacterium sp. MS1601]
MTLHDRFDPDELIDVACDAAGGRNFGDAYGWSDGLELLCDGLVNEAKLSPLGVEIAHADVVRALVNRLQMFAWRKAHPEVAEQRIEQPVVIVGQPRTGTTILYDLLSLDPEFRAPLTWEVDNPVPPPQPQTYRDDPRIATTQAGIDLSEQIAPGLLALHPMGARMGQECVRIFGSQFASMIFSVQYRLPTYYKWLLYDADHSGAYRFHRMFLQHLQSGVPGQWLLKSPAHLWQLDTLLDEYPDAVVVQTHRDPLNVISSISALTHHLRRMATDESTIAECAAQSYEEIIVGLEREMRVRETTGLQVIDVLFNDFIRDPWTTVKSVYQQLGRELRPDVELAMREHLAAHPGDGGVGRYTWADTGLDAGEVRERVRGYQDRYGVPDERLR